MRKVLLLLIWVLVVGLAACAPEPTMYVTGGTRYVDLTGAAIGGAIANSHVQGTDTTLGIMSADINMGTNDITNVGLVDGVDVSGIGGSSHAQNTDWTLKDSAGGANLINNGVIVDDMRTDRWESNDTNTFFGVGAASHGALDDSLGGGNSAYGSMSQHAISTGYFNTAVGNLSEAGITTGIGNVAVGENTLGSLSTGSFNTAIGTDSLWQNNNNYNVALGMNAGANNLAGVSNVFLGYAAGQDELGSNKLYIANSADTTPLIYGDFSTDAVTINEDLTVADDAEVIGTLNLSGDAIIKTDKTSARDLTITTGAVKTILLSTPVYDDMQISMANVKTPASNAPNWVAYKESEIPAFSKTATNVLYFTAQLPHTYKEGTDLEFHIHIAYPDTGAGNSIWYMTYSWTNIDGNFPAASNSGNVTLVSPTVADRHTAPPIIATISGAGKTVSSVLLCSISRLGGDGSDDYDNVIYLVSGDFHYQKDTLGSRQQLIK